jgi:glyoxylase-like metal-dependent hydrolase (beta-lactamase superfamily II)
MGNESFSFKVGQFSCMAINDSKDGNCNCLLIDTGQHKVLIETGCGDATSRPGLLLDRLQAVGIAPAEIDVVILSHGDIDHSSGLIDERGKAAFPHARQVLARAEWDFWSSQSPRTSPLHLEVMGEEWTRLAETIPRARLPQVRDKLDLIEPETEIVPGIRAIPAPGHLPGHMAIAVSSGEEQLLFIGDVLYDSDLNNEQNDYPQAIGNPAWHATVDVDPAQALLTRDRLFAQAARERTLLMAYHVPFPGLAYVEQHGTGWRWRPLEVPE